MSMALRMSAVYWKAEDPCNCLKTSEALSQNTTILQFQFTPAVSEDCIAVELDGACTLDLTVGVVHNINCFRLVFHPFLRFRQQ